MSARVTWLVVATLTFWLLAAVPARWLGGGNAAFLYSGTAALLCLIPGVVALVWAGLSSKDPYQQLTVAMGSTSIRIFFVLGVAFLLERTLPIYHGSVAFWIWVLVFYLLTLVVETTLLVAGRSSRGNS